MDKYALVMRELPQKAFAPMGISVSGHQTSFGKDARQTAGRLRNGPGRRTYSKAVTMRHATDLFRFEFRWLQSDTAQERTEILAGSIHARNWR